MRSAVILLVLGVAAAAPTDFQILIGEATAIAGDQITVQSGGVSTLLFAGKDSRIWRGKTTNTLSIVQPADRVMIKYRRDSAGRLVILELYANMEHIWGRITKIATTGFEVDQNYNADPHSGYRRQLREITFDADTQWEESTPESLRVGRDVDIQAVTSSGSRAQASRITVYEGKAPVRMQPDARIITPSGAVQTRK